MPSKNTKIISLRVPERVKFDGISVSTLITNLYDEIQRGGIEVLGDRIVIPENTCDGCPYLGVNLDKLYEVCEIKNLDPQKALDRCVQMLWR